MNGEALGTLLRRIKPLWQRASAGRGSASGARTLVLDAGAVNVLRGKGSSLLAVGVRDVQGSFKRGDMVLCVDEQGTRVAKGLVNYGADEARQLAGQPSHQSKPS